MTREVTVSLDLNWLNILLADRKLYVHHPQGQQFVEACIMQRDRYVGEKVHTYIDSHTNTEFLFHGFHQIVIADIYVNQVLLAIAKPFLTQKSRYAHLPAG